jgi:sugar lactone lactonase YvrE
MSRAACHPAMVRYRETESRAKKEGYRVLSTPNLPHTMKTSFAPACFLAIALTSAAQAGWKNYDDAEVILGRTALPTASTFYQPQDLAINPASGKVYVVDGGNNRVLRFSSAAALGNGQAAEAVFGQPDMTTAEPGVGAASLNGPISAAIDAAGRLWVTDTENYRVLRWDNADNAANGADAVQVLGQPNFTSHGAITTQTGLTRPGGLAFDGLGRLWVADYFGNRVLRYDNPSSKGNGGAADGVLGQPNFTSKTSGTSATQFKEPFDVEVDAQGRLWVTDFSNARILRFDTPDSQIQPAADGVLGQPDFTSGATGSGPAQNNRLVTLALASNGSLFAVDSQNRRVLRWDNAAAKANGAAADGALGRLGLDGNAETPPITGEVTDNIRGLVVDAAGRLWGVDRGFERVMRWDNAINKANGASADGVIGQPNTSTTIKNIYDPTKGPGMARQVLEDPVSGKFFIADNGRVLRYANRSAAESGVAPEAALGKSALAYYGGGSATAENLRSAWGLAMDSAGKLWVSDPEGCRLVAFANAATAATGATMSVVLGQQNFFDTSPALSQTRLDSPRAIAIDVAGNLYVADRNNYRVLRFNDIANKTSGAAADAVIGQVDFITASAASNPALLEQPEGVCCDAAGRLWVADGGNNRVVRYDTPLSMAPLDLPSGTLGVIANLTPTGMSIPSSVAVSKSGRLWVMDTGFNRVLRFENAAAKANGAPADGDLAAPGLASGISFARTTKSFYRPMVIAFDLAENLWVGDENNSRMMRFSPEVTAFIVEKGFDKDGHFTLTFQGEANISYTVTSSTDLKTWEVENTYVLGAPGTQLFTDSKGGSKRFFRIEEP